MLGKSPTPRSLLPSVESMIIVMGVFVVVFQFYFFVLGFCFVCFDFFCLFGVVPFLFFPCTESKHMLSI